MIKASTTYALTGLDNIVLAKGSKKDMHRIQKHLAKTKNMKSLRIWNAPSSNIGDKLK